MDEILFTMPYFLLMVIVFSITNMVQVENKLYIIVSLIKCLMYTGVYVIAHRLKNYRAYGMFLLFVISQTASIIKAFYTIGTYTDQIRFDLALRANCYTMTVISCFFSLCAVPNTKWFAMFTLALMGCLAILSIKFGDLDNEMFKETLQQQPFNIMSSFVCYHIAQNIRLNRFFKERRIKLQSEQMSDVLNSQSDAILAYEKINLNSSGNYKPLNILFSNLKAFKLFSYDFSTKRDLHLGIEQEESKDCIA